MQQTELPKHLWEFNQPEKEIVQELARAMEMPPFVAAVLVQRGFTDTESAISFLNPSLDDLHDPFLMDDMERAVERIRQALVSQEKVLVCGDYDVDGITSVALLKRSLPNSGIDVFTYLPNRLSEGYGFHEHSVCFAREIGATLMITVDCGITSRETVDYARQFGIDTIITDHHEQNGPLPNAVAVLNPKRENSSYPDDNLAGIGVAFKLVSALIQRGMLRFPITSMLELVALGTVADVAKLVGENRILVFHGLQALTHTSHAGLKALKKVAHIIPGRSMDPYTIGYQLGPRINAVGRLGAPEFALNLLLATSNQEAEQIARKMDQVNHKRQSIEEGILTTVRQEVDTMDLNAEPFIIVNGEDWHEGVIGIVASKITDRYFRPTCVITIKEGVGKGSGRSIPSFSLFDCLNQVSEHLIEFGGHQIAAGFRISPDKISDFKAACQAIAKKMLKPEDLIPSTEIDAQVEIQDVNFRSIRSLNRLAPFGLGNPKPKFLLKHLHHQYPPRLVGADGNHLKLTLASGNRYIDAIAFGFGQYFDKIVSAESLDVIATPEINQWNQRELLQLQIHDIRIYP
ncbi:single-stranded-DNA-specific exonuclease RecJ [bacterium]|nr:single-stranded-DNA-specific exonuclease RecJ [candidate division CSSED10-310 bacterium]